METEDVSCSLSLSLSKLKRVLWLNIGSWGVCLYFIQKFRDGFEKKVFGFESFGLNFIRECWLFIQGTWHDYDMEWNMFSLVLVRVYISDMVWSVWVWV